MTTETQPNLVEVRQLPGVTVVRFINRTILEPSAIETLGDRLFRLVREENCRQLVLDFSQVESLTSAMLGKFASLQASIAEAGGHLVCCNVGDFLRQIFTVCGFPQSIPIYPDETSALRALAGEGSE